MGFIKKPRCDPLFANTLTASPILHRAAWIPEARAEIHAPMDMHHHRTQAPMKGLLHLGAEYDVRIHSHAFALVMYSTCWQSRTHAPDKNRRRPGYLQFLRRNGPAAVHAKRHASTLSRHVICSRPNGKCNARSVCIHVLRCSHHET